MRAADTTTTPPPPATRRLMAGKSARMVRRLLDGPLHRFDAERLGDHCLPSTVTGIQRRGIRVDRRMVTIPTRWGGEAHVCEYWIASDQRAIAIAQLPPELRTAVTA